VKTILIAALFSLLSSILVTPLVVAYFRRRGFGQEIRTDGPQRHLTKRGTPTMGGVAIVGSTVFGYGVAHLIIALRGGGGPMASGLLALYLMVGLGTVGFLDMFLWDGGLLADVRSAGMRVQAAPAVFGYGAVGYPRASSQTGSRPSRALQAWSRRVPT